MIFAESPMMLFVRGMRLRSGVHAASIATPAHDLGTALRPPAGLPLPRGGRGLESPRSWPLFSNAVGRTLLRYRLRRNGPDWMDVIEDALQRAELLEQANGRLGAHAGHAGDVV